MKPQVIYFDFDRTLLDTDSLKEEQALRISKISNLSIEQVHDGMKRYIKSIKDKNQFEPEGYASFLEDLYGINPSDVLKIYITDSNYIAEHLFPESLEVLRKLKEKGFSLGIFSAASPGHQRLKIERTGVLEFIEEHLIIIHPQKLGAEGIGKLPENVVVVDDDLGIIKGLATHAPRITPIWCNRKTMEVLQNVRTIHNLRDLLL